MKLENEISLKPLTTFRTGGLASYFCRIKYIQDLEEAADFLHKSKLPFFVLGEGSNTLAADSGFSGLVMKMEICGTKIYDIDEWRTEIVAGAGENWDNLVATSVSKGLYGIENLSGIPGSVGAVPVQNIGAYGAEVKDVISFVEVFDPDRPKDPPRKMTAEECQFSYRDSIFKKQKGKKLVITKVGFVLEKRGQVNIGYKDLKERFKEKYSKDVTLQELRAAVLDIRAHKLPDVKKIGTAGSFFKNPIIAKAHYEVLKEKWPDMPGFAEEGKIKVPLAWILDNVCSLKGWRLPDSQIGTYENQPIALVNFGDGTSDDVKKAAQHIADMVKARTDIDIEWEVQMLG